MIVWTKYLIYRANLRGYDLALLEDILRYSEERYHDQDTGRMIVIGRHRHALVMIAYETADADWVPVTVHAITRQQIRFRLQTGRFQHE